MSAPQGRPSGIRFMVLSALAFSVMSLLVKVVGERIPSQEVVLARALVSLALSYLLLRRAGIRVWGTRRKILILRGMVGFCGLSCFYFAITRLPLAEVTVLQYLHPVFTAILAAIFLREEAGARLGLSLALCLAGVVLVTRPALLFGAGTSGFEVLPVLAAFGGAFFSATAYVLVRELARTEHPLVIVFYFPLVAVPLSVPTVIGQAVWPQGLEWLLLLGVGLSTQVGQVALTRGLKLEPAGRATSMSYLQVVFAALWGALCFGEIPDLLAVSGTLLIVGGTLLVALRGKVGG